MSPPVIAVDGLRVERVGHVILDIPCLAISDGEVVGVLGPNGAGKSTLLRCLALLERPTAGRISFRGQEVRWSDAIAYRRRTAMLLQEPLLFDTTVFENVATGLRLRGIPKPEMATRVISWLDRLNIGHLAQRSARTLSGGEARRVSVARALVLDPDILFLDEPFTSLDAPTRASFIRDLANLLDEHQTTTVLVTHDRAEARALADRVTILLQGKVAQSGATEVVFRQPASAAVEAFLRSADLPERRAVGRGEDAKVGQ